MGRRLAPKTEGIEVKEDHEEQVALDTERALELRVYNYFRHRGFTVTMPETQQIMMDIRELLK